MCTTMEQEEGSADEPLYVRVPGYLHRYLDEVKTHTGINKSDSVTLILELACKYLTPPVMEALWNDYLLLGSEGIEIDKLRELITEDINRGRTKETED